MKHTYFAIRDKSTGLYYTNVRNYNGWRPYPKLFPFRQGAAQCAEFLAKQFDIEIIPVEVEIA